MTTLLHLCHDVASEKIMRPKQLRYPFKAERTPSIFVEDRVWYVPQVDADVKPYVFPGWEASEFFGNQQPIQVEYCSGNGAWIAARAQQMPTVNWVAVEKKFDRVRKIWSKVQNLGLKNLLVVYGEALQVTQQYFPSASVEAVYINFPDPWPKRHHARHRLLAQPFLAELERCLKVGGQITLVTDDAVYSQASIDLFRQQPAFSPCWPEPYYTEEMEGYGSSFFESLWRGQGCAIRYSAFRRVAS